MNIAENLRKFGLSPLVAVVDLETMDTQPSAKIATIGCVITDLSTHQLKSEFYVRVEHADIDDQPCRTVNFEAIDFWSEQAKTNRDACIEIISSDNRLSLSNALDDLNHFLLAHYPHFPVVLMGNGSDFDNVILQHAFAEQSIEPCWPYNTNQSLRTALLITRALTGLCPKASTPFDGVKHHALHDARHEAKLLLDSVEMLSRQYSEVAHG